MKVDNSPARGIRDLFPASVAVRDHVLESISALQGLTHDKLGDTLADALPNMPGDAIEDLAATTASSSRVATQPARSMSLSCEGVPGWAGSTGYSCRPRRSPSFTNRLVKEVIMIEFQLDAASGVATYLQLAQQVCDALRLGLLEPGDRLPTAQQVVAKPAINPNTVLKAYRDLEREGLVAAGRAWARSSSGRCPAPTLPPRDDSSPR